MDPERVPAGRAVCAICQRPRVVCYCRYIHPLPTRTRVLLLQHPRESRMAVGTARMAHLSLPNSVLRVGLDFAADPVVARELRAPAQPVLLFPGPTAHEVTALPRVDNRTLVVVDGTWWQAGKLLRLNPALAALPRVSFTPHRPSNYRIRKQPAAFCVSTIEALAEVLAILEENTAFASLLTPFTAMVDEQQRFQTERHAIRHRGGPRVERAQPIDQLAARLRANLARLVCVQGEANAWPARTPDRPPPEIIHWVAHRPATGETFDAIITPRRSLAPSTARHVDLSPGRILAGVGLADWHAAWASFSRADDVLVTWGDYYATLARGDGLRLPAESLDLRAQISWALRTRVGTLEACVERLQAPRVPPSLSGRGGARLEALVAAVKALVARASGRLEC